MHTPTSNCKLRKDQNREAVEDASEDWERLLDLLLSIKTIVIKTITTWLISYASLSATWVITSLVWESYVGKCFSWEQKKCPSRPGGMNEITHINLCKIASRYNNRVDMHEYYSYAFHCFIRSPHQILYLSRRQSLLVLPDQAKT